jgi:hypothetical protein
MKMINHTELLNLNPEVNEYGKKEIENAIKLAEKVNDFYPAKAMFNVSEYEGKTYYEHPVVVLVHPTLKLEVSMYKKKFSISCPSLNDFKNVSWHQRENVENQLNKPNQIGVLTDKKILAWVNYYEAFCYGMADVNNEGDKAHSEFLKSIEGLEVQRNGKSGTIVKNGIEFNFTLEAGYVSTNIQLHYKASATIETFLKLSNNKF